MSLTSFIQRQEVAARLKPFRPSPPRKINAPLRATPRTNHWSLVGTAFDYILRFEIKRRAPHAQEKGWIADSALFQIDNIQHEPHLQQQVAASGRKESEVYIACHRIVDEATDDYSAFVKLTTVAPAEMARMATHALRLATLDPIFRAGLIDVTLFADPDPADVEDLLALLDLVPFGDLLHDSTLLLDPSFGTSSALVGGADVDLISGDRLIDFKTTKEDRMDPRHLDQIFGWFLLARNQHRLEPSFPEIKKLGLYFCRHGYLWLKEVSEWTGKPGFAELEEWFHEHAKDVVWFKNREAKTAWSGL